MTDKHKTSSEFKFEKLEVWQLSLDYVDLCYALINGFPIAEEHNLKSQLTRAATSIALNIAEGSISQTDAEQARFLGMALRSLVETVACRRLAQCRGYFKTIDHELVTQAEQLAQKLFAKLQAMRRALRKSQRSTVRGQNLPAKTL